MKNIFIIASIAWSSVVYCQTSFQKMNNFSFIRSNNLLLKVNPLNIGVIEYEKGNFNKAVSLFSTATLNNELKVSAINNIGVINAKTGKYNLAMQTFEYAAKKCLKTPDYLTYNKFLALEGSRNYKVGITLLNGEIGLSENQDYNVGLAFSHTGDYNNAQELYNRAIYNSPDNWKSYYNLALDFYKQDKVDDAENILNSAPEFAITKPEFANIAGIIAAENRDFKKAKEYLKINKNGENNNRSMELSLANVNICLGKTEGFSKIYRLLKNNKGCDEIEIYTKGNIELAKTDYSSALKSYRSCKRKNPNESTYYTAMGNAFCGNGDYEKAMEQYNKAITLNSDDYYAYIGIGTVNYKLGRYNDASYAFNESMPLLENLQTGYDIFVMAGYSFYKASNPGNSLKLISKAIEIDSTQDAAYAIRALINYEAGAFNLAIQDLKKAININPNDNQYHEVLGSIYQFSYDFKKARKCFSKAILINSSSVYAKNGLALALGQLGKTKRALRIFNKLIEKNNISYLYNNRAIVRDEIGKEFLFANDTTKANSLFRASIADIDTALSNEYVSWFYINRGNSLTCLGNDTDAVINYHKNEDKYAYNNLGILYAKNNKIEKAVSFFEAAAKADSNYVVPQYNLSIANSRYGYRLSKEIKTVNFPVMFTNKSNRTLSKEFYTTYLYYLPATIDAPNNLSFLSRFLHEPLIYCDFIFDFQFATSDLAITINSKEIHNLHLRHKIRQNYLKIKKAIVDIFYTYQHCPSYD